MAKRFTWRLEQVRRLKGREEERKQQDLAEALAQLQSVIALRFQLEQQQEACRIQLLQFQSGRLNPIDLRIINTYLEDLSHQHRELETNLREAHSRVAEKREALMKTVREKQALNNLKERDYRAFQKEERRRDQVAMDEIASRRKTT